jgi:hypothetical protein
VTLLYPFLAAIDDCIHQSFLTVPSFQVDGQEEVEGDLQMTAEEGNAPSIKM